MKNHLYRLLTGSVIMIGLFGILSGLAYLYDNYREVGLVVCGVTLFLFLSYYVGFDLKRK